MKPRLVLLASGRGTCFEAICRGVREGKIPAKIEALVCNRAEAPVVDKARALKIQTEVLDKSAFPGGSGKWDRAAYERALENVLARWNPDWIVLAGYMLLLGPGILKRWKGRVVNIHPSLLPQFKGLHAQKQALEAGVTETGCTVHFVTEALDDGPVLEQARLPILPGDTEKSLSERLLPLEHATYVHALARLCSEPYRIEKNRVVWG